MAAEYGRLLHASLLFYEAQRSGPLPDDNRIPWRKSSGLADGSTAGVDLVGGYYDAGDFVKFNFPQSFALTMLSWGALEFRAGFDSVPENAEWDQLADTLRWGMDYLVKCHQTGGMLYAEVGDPAIDHNYWGPPQDMPQNRAVFSINNSTRPGTDLAASVASAFAATSMVFRQRPDDQDYGQQLLAHAKSIYAELVDIPARGKYTDAIPQARDSYGSSSYLDDVVWVSSWLYLATNDTSYVAKADSADDAMMAERASGMPPLGWDDKSVGATLLLAAHHPTNAPKYQARMDAYLSSLGKGKSSSTTPGGMLWFPGDSDGGSSAVANNAAFVAVVYAQHLNGSSPTGNSPSFAIPSDAAAKVSAYTDLGLSQVRYFLGGNPLNVVYVTGINANSPINPHHAASHGGTSIDSPVNNMYTLPGAVVGGPASDDAWADKRADYVHNEVALDYNAAWTGLMARQAALADSGPSYPTQPIGRLQSSASLPGWAIALLACFVVALITAGGWFLLRRKRRIPSPQPDVGKSAEQLVLRETH
ncbi:hypothetical protein RI367_005896 [Sorochytrium milnesiophthora]